MQATSRPVIPKFPDFKCLTWNDRADIEHFTKEFPPYSDFNFNSLQSWNINDEMCVSQLNDNLVVQFNDYLTDSPFLSFIGLNDPTGTASTLLEYSRSKLGENALRLLPEVIAERLCRSSFEITSDRDSFDYIYSIDDLCRLPQWPRKYKATLNLRTFLREYTSYECKCCLLNEASADNLRQLYALWASVCRIDHYTTNEYRSFERLIGSVANILVVFISIDGILKGFVLYELLTNGYCMAHFNKADISYKGIYEVLHWHSGQILSDHGIQYINFEQDLGISTLRQSKGKYKLHSFLRKVTIKKVGT